MFSFFHKTILSVMRKTIFFMSKINYKKWNRINPWYEDLLDWKKRAQFAGLGENVTLYNSSTVIGDVTVGDNTWVGPFTMLDGSGGLSIGKYCSVATGVQIYTHDTVKWALSGGTAAHDLAEVVIGDCCFIGADSIILKGITLGKHCLVQANSMVKDSFEDYSIVAGNPAIRIGTVKLDAGNVRLYFDK